MGYKCQLTGFACVSTFQRLESSQLPTTGHDLDEPAVKNYSY